MEISPSIVCNNKSETTDLDYGEKHVFSPKKFEILLPGNEIWNVSDAL